MLMRVLMTLVLGIALVATVGCGPKPAEPAPSEDGGATQEQTQVETSAEPDAAPAEASAEPETEMEASEPAEGSQAEEAAEGSEAEAAAEALAAVEALTAETLVGTKWEYQGITIEMQADNKVLINDYIEGTWDLDGDVLTLSSDMGDYEASIDGAAIVYDGAALNRVQ